jgi:nitrogen fixation protein NifU and related proteins
MSLDSLYQETILDHARNPRNHGALDGPKVAIHQENPSCGDQIDLHLLIEDGRVQAIRFTGRGCAISQASASLMTLAVEGKTIADAHRIIGEFRKMIVEDELNDELGDLEALHGVRKFPVRVKCAMLAWNALEKLIKPE